LCSEKQQPSNSLKHLTKSPVVVMVSRQSGMVKCHRTDM